VPDGAAGQKPFALLRSAMAKEKLVCVAQVVLHNKEQLVTVRPLDTLLCMTVLRYASQIKDIELFQDDISAVDISKDEAKLAETLIAETTAKAFDISEFSDTYTERLTQLIEAKVEGKEIVAAPAIARPPVINLMDALKASVAQVRGTSGKAGAAAPVQEKVAKRKAKSATVKKKVTSSTSQQLAQTLATAAKKKKPSTGKRKKKTG
jgi:DNA end-binding protein Ku